MIGVVTSDKMTKTRRVEIPRLVRHPMYGKFVRRRTVCYVHDEQEQSHVGDRVEIEECRPMSRNKRWNLVQVLEKSRAVDVAALRAKRGAGETAEAKPAETEAAKTEAAGQE
jgi:small subunit ribosomal protein S17